MKRNLFMITTSVLSLSLVLGGCTAKNEASPSPSAGASSAPANSNLNESGLPIVKDKVTIKAVAQSAELAPAYGEMEIFKRLEQTTNVKVEWSNIPKADYQQKKNLLMSTGNLPELFYGADFTDTDIVNYSKDGTIIPLDDLINKYMPNLKKLFEKNPALKAFVTSPDGHIYALPSGEELGFGQEGIGSNPDFMFLNKAWLDKLNMQIPTTIDELHDVLAAFKTKDPNGNGKADEVPMSFMNTFWTGDIGYLFGAFGVPDKTYQPADNTYAEHLNVKNGKVSFSAVDPKYKEAVAYFHKWVEEGLIDKESFTYNNNPTPYFAKGKTKDVTLGSYLWWEETEIVGKDRVKDYVLIPPFKNMVVKYNNGSQWARASEVITKAAKNPEIIARWLDYQFEPKITAQMHWGPIGVAFEEKDGKLVQKELPQGESAGEFRQKVAPNQSGVVTAEDFKTIVAPEPRAQERMDRIKKFFVPQMEKENYPLIFFTPEELDKIAKIKPDLQKFVDQKRTKWLMDGGVEKDWDAYLSTLKKMGLDDLMKIYQDGLDRYNKAAKK
ncbi:extracellular solute-binding protein [Paenibacillus sp. Soil787]|uniref:extracellular solute-binding protein n=1 Tax=Paenibacillus sp. Soil787 TaxID=1736411 RepID=UPI0006FA78B3|nr:extracellular solute-binding protein [Paenibacillus sp. Soil787]KRF42168.1 ABC transporter substrate-binding protein [Paenibacillus sp. Soil787]